MPKIITRAEAKERGLKRYFTGKACSRGHIEERLISNGCCFECSRENHRKYWNNSARDHGWREEYNYSRRNSVSVRESHRRYRAKNKERILVREKMQRAKRAHKRKEESKRWRQNNAQHVYECAKKWRRNNREKYLAQQRKKYYYGPQNPKGDGQWLRKNRVLLRNLKRLLKNQKAGRLNGLPEEFRT